ncbi:MAG: ankyrin repeat domain-containing protein [Rickettsia endosymbiont of Culicoides impunctatus]|nr:MAG: ankyrin repeat domain-containing protein [Rickettsia endosymbiont of Culicoides impunctatus]
MLKEASKSQHLAAFDLALAKITDLDYQDIDGKTVLMHAIINGFYYGVDKLLQKGADVNLIDKQGANALIYCAQIPHIKYIKQIAEKTADINYKSALFDGGTALHLIIANTQNVLFFSEVQLELKLTNLAYFDVEQGGHAVCDLESNMGAIMIGRRESDGYTIQQEKTLAITKFLTDRGADINAQNDKGLTPFFLACTHKFNYLASCFVNQFQLDFSIKDFKGNMSLHYATLLEDTNILQLILNKGVDINSQNSGGGTALSFVICNDKKPMVEFLLNKGADVNVAAKDGGYPLHLAVNNNALELINLLVKYDDINARTTDEHKVTALWLAAQDGKLEIVKILADLGADLNIVRVTTGMPPLHVAMQKKHPEVAEELLARGADVNIVDAGGWIALHWGVNLEDINIVKNILTKGTNINAKSIVGATSLFCDVSNGNKLITELLINQQADTNIASNEGVLPWHIASFKGFIEIMKILAPTILDIDYKTTNTEQYTALWLASQQGHVDIVKWLIDKGADINAIRQSDGCTALQTAICKEQLQVIEWLVAKGANVNKADKEEASPLYYSLGYAGQPIQPNIVKFLVSKGADVKQSMYDGDTPLHMACYRANTGAIKLLLDHGASINEVNNDGYTPLHFLVSAENTIEVDKKLTAIKYLLERSASSTVKNKEGKSAIDLAKDNFPEALPWLEHPENLPSIGEFEASIIGINDFAI